MMESSPCQADRADAMRRLRPGPMIRFLLLSALIATASGAWAQIGRPLSPGDDPLRDRWERDPVRVDHELFMAANLASGDAALGIAYPKSRDFPGAGSRIEAPASLYRRIPATTILNGAAGRVMGTPYEQVALVTEDADGTHVDIYSGLRPGQVHIGRFTLPSVCETPGQVQCRVPGPIEIVVADFDGFDLSRPDLGPGDRCLASNRRHDEVAVAYAIRADVPPDAFETRVRVQFLSWEAVDRGANPEAPPAPPSWATTVSGASPLVAEDARFRLVAAQIFVGQLNDGQVDFRDLLLVQAGSPPDDNSAFDDGLALFAQGWRIERSLAVTGCGETPARTLTQVGFRDTQGVPGGSEDRTIEAIGGPVAVDAPARDGWDVVSASATELEIRDGDDGNLVPDTDALVAAWNGLDVDGMVNGKMAMTVAVWDPAGGNQQLILRTNNGFFLSEFPGFGFNLELRPDSRVRLRTGLIPTGNQNLTQPPDDTGACLVAGFWVQADTNRGPVVQSLFAGDANPGDYGPPLLRGDSGELERIQPIWPDLNGVLSGSPSNGLANLQFAVGGFLRERDSVELDATLCGDANRYTGDIDSLYIARPDAMPQPGSGDSRLQVVGNVRVDGGELDPLISGGIRPLDLLSSPDHFANVGTEFVSVNMDIDGNGSVDAATDGAMLLRFLMGLRGEAVTENGALIGAGCTRCSSDLINDYLVANAEAFDADDNGLADGLSDGILRLRFIQGETGSALTGDVVAANCRRCDAGALADYLRLPQDDPVVEVPVMLAFDADANSAHYRRFESGVGSIFLSEGASHVLRDVETFDVILAEPPKHLDYLPALGGVTNISATADLFATFETTETQSQEITRETTTDFTLSESESTTRTVTAGLDLFGVAGGSVEGSVSTLTSNEFNETSSNFQGESSSFSITQVSRAERDDQLVTRLNDLFIWRYPAMNVPDADGSASGERFFEIFQPTRPLNFFSAGRVNDAYQPWHTNNNLLGYPVFDGNTFQPSIDELGQFRVVGDDSDTPRFEPIWNESAFTIGGLSFEQRIEFTESTEAGTSLVTSNTVTETRDTSVKASASAAGAFKGIGVSAGFSEARNWQASSSFSYAQGQFASTETDAETAISLNIPGDLAGERGYRFHPAWFFTADGGLKLTHAVALEGMGVIPETFWQTHYSGPDPALNLPFRFTLDVSTTVPDVFLLNTDATRNSTKGMFFRDGRGINPRNAAERRGTDLSFAPQAGDPVQVEMRVYNLSVGTPVENLEVRFEAQRFELGREVGPRIPIGEDRIPFLPYRGQVSPDPQQPLSELAHVRSAFVLWDTTDFGSDQPDELATWKIYAVLDPDDEIADETHELVDRFDDPLLDIDGRPIDPLPGASEVFLEKGQNNTGWSLLRVAPTDTDTATRRAEGDASITLAELALAGDQGRGAVEASTGEPTALRLTLASDRLSRRTHRVLVYDGPPEAGGDVIAYEHVRGLDPAGLDLPIPWQPREPGRHELYLVLPDQPRSERNPGPALTVDVR